MGGIGGTHRIVYFSLQPRRVCWAEDVNGANIAEHLQKELDEVNKSWAGMMDNLLAP